MTDPKYSHDDDVYAFLAGLFLGLFGCGILAVLFAPKPGTAVREDIHDFIANLPEKVNDEIRDSASPTRVMLDKTRMRIERQVDKAHNRREANRMAAAKRREEEASGYELN